MLSKIIRIAKEKRLTSIADFIGTRYGRDHTLAILITIVALLGVIPYVALQLKAIATYLRAGHPAHWAGVSVAGSPAILGRHGLSISAGPWPCL